MKLKVLALAIITALSTGNIQAAPNTVSESNQSVKNSSLYLKTFKSKYSAENTIAKIRQALNDKNIKIFTIIDHQAAAKEAGLSMPFSSVIVFGKPQIGTPMMIESPTLAIDLPLKALVWENNQGEIFVSLNKNEVIAEKHNVTTGNIEKMNKLVKLITESVTE
ncbi:DUF302 domain-containing protein [Aggregatibacter actinomycetemcomitans]|uniref:DUF302 domain-containing protein n=1 Tax=Aggregatibacter actinomycetemcomitans TaxID=714 RepID=UPI00197C316E|nr:DUF302 domain-containing protein [Aggregatibacter actinomycetemcomitans]MBN6077528.1 DUF302 domain-containing protein [Aggregatibacter actinomycetemcomitans]